MRLIVLFMAILTIVVVMSNIYESGEVSLWEMFLLALDMFFIIGISAKLI